MSTRWRDWLIGFALITAGFVIAVPSLGSPAVQGDPAARAEIDAAFQRLKALPSYRMKATSSKDGATSLYEFVHPDKSHVTVRSSQYVYEVFTVGKQSSSRMTAPGQPAGWQCAPLSAPVLGLFGNIDQFQKDLDTTPVARKPDTVVEGMPVHAYAEGTGTLYVGVRTGLPRRIVDTDKENGGTITVDFYDYGAKITIVLPACQ